MNMLFMILSTQWKIKFLVSDPGVLHPLPASTKLWYPILFVWEQDKNLRICVSFFFFILTVFNESCRQDDFIPASSQLFLPYICPFPFLLGEIWLYVRGSFCGLCPVLVWTSHLAGMNAHMDSCAISLLPLHSFNVDDVCLPVNLDYFANLLPFVVPSYNLNFIILSDGHGSNVVLLS